MYIAQSQLVKQIIQAYKNYLQIIAFSTNNGGMRGRISYSITKNYCKSMMAK